MRCQARGQSHAELVRPAGLEGDLLAAEDVTLGVLVGPLQRVGTGTDRLRPYGVEVHVCAPVGRNAIGTHLLETRVLHDVGKLGPSRSVRICLTNPHAASRPSGGVAIRPPGAPSSRPWPPWGPTWSIA